jgi:diadenosine tetraphosphate (Ap4A) HIT family hydrolase
MVLSDLFVPDSNESLPHRARALAAMEKDVWQLHLDVARGQEASENRACADVSVFRCPFCAELDDDAVSIFTEMINGRLDSRIVYEDEHFILMPPLGEFMSGGLLLLSRKHILSFAHLPAGLFAHLERLVKRISDVVADRWGVPPLVFEHGPAPERSKGLCCVDHAHLNIFPARVEIYPSLRERMNQPLGPLSDLQRFRDAEFGYLFVQENDGTRRAYDAENVPTQLVRRVIATAIGHPDRWHWRDYPGYSELIDTYHALKGQISL